MPVLKTRYAVEFYQAIARHRPASELSGRGANQELTSLRAEIAFNALQLNSSDTVLDIGCGDGAFLRIAAPVVTRATGTVVTIEEVALLRSQNPKMAVTGGFVVALPFPDASFSAVCCNNVLHHVSMWAVPRALSEIHRVLKPQGRAFLGEVLSSPETYTVDRNSPFSWLRSVWQSHGLEGLIAGLRDLAMSLFSRRRLMLFLDTKHFSHFRPEQFAIMCRDAGFEIVQQNTESVRADYLLRRTG
jgi:ubiquinone/menaquinone biosynthesis C-methylase UbiE